MYRSLGLFAAVSAHSSQRDAGLLTGPAALSAVSARLARTPSAGLPGQLLRSPQPPKYPHPVYAFLLLWSAPATPQ